MALSQDEIDKLMDNDSAQPSAESIASKNLIAKIGDSFVRSLENIIPILVSADKIQVGANEPVLNNIGSQFSSMVEDHIFCVFEMKALCEAPWIAYLSKNLALEISQKMMGQEDAEALDEALISALVEAFNNLLGAYDTTLMEEFDDENVAHGEIKFFESDPLTSIKSDTEIALDTDVWHIQVSTQLGEFSGNFGLAITHNSLAEMVKKHPSILEAAAADIAEAKPEPETPSQPEATEATAAPDAAVTPAGGVQPETAVFEELEPRASAAQSKGIDLILDVPLNITVELGRKNLSVKEILGLNPGSLVELEKLAGEAVDLMVNGKLFARGEVVVIDENFGVRISNIITPKERLERLGD